MLQLLRMFDNWTERMFRKIGSVAGSGVGALQGGEARRQGLPQDGIAGAVEHSEQVTGNGHRFEPPVGSTYSSICSGS